MGPRRAPWGLVLHPGFEALVPALRCLLVAPTPVDRSEVGSVCLVGGFAFLGFDFGFVCFVGCAVHELVMMHADPACKGKRHGGVRLMSIST